MNQGNAGARALPEEPPGAQGWLQEAAMRMLANNLTRRTPEHP